MFGNVDGHFAMKLCTVCMKPSYCFPTAIPTCFVAMFLFLNRQPGLCKSSGDGAFTTNQHLPLLCCLQLRVVH